MAGFKTHIGASTAVGIGYGAVGYALGVPPSTCIVAAGLCSVSGMLPDLDSDSGVPVREMWALVAAFVPALMIPRFVQLGFDTEHMAVAAAAIYLGIRFGVQEIFKRFSVHRGMWHSIPAAAIAGLLAFLIVSGTSLEIRLFKTAAVVLGFLIHLALDEFYSVEVRRGRLRIKKSLGTALKFWTTKALWPNIATYGKVALLILLVIEDPYLMDQLGVDREELVQRPKEWFGHAVKGNDSWLPSWDFAGRQQDASPLTRTPPDSSLEMVPVELPWEQPASVEETARRAFDYPATGSPVRR